MPEASNQDREVLDRLDKSFDAFEKLLANKNAEIERLKAEKKKEVEALLARLEDLKRDYADLENADQAAFDDLESRLRELSKGIEALTSSVPIRIGTLVCPTENGRVLILDGHRVPYEVALHPDINPDEIEEGSEVQYTVDPQSGMPIGVFAVHKIRREEEIIRINAVVDDSRALALFPGDVIKFVNIARKVRGKIEKGDDVYYDPRVNFVTEKVPKTEEKIDLRHVQKKTWADIGGLKKQVQEIREVVELPLMHPELFEKLGISRTKGVLVSGPPGCGKTLIGRILANETSAFFIHISGPEIISSYVGESEARLRALFDAARKNAPAIVFLDEVEAISEKRDEVEHSHERRLVAQLLALMDGLTSSEQVIVIAATNKPNLLDEALRRPGRFDREIEISVPDEEGRLEILKIHSSKMPLAKDVSLEQLAKVTHGFTGADLEGLCKEAGMRVLRGVDFQKVGSSPINLEVAAAHFNAALSEMKPSAMREISFDKPAETWGDVGGLEDAKKILVEAVQWPLLYPELLRFAKQRPASGVLLYGPPGCGKTLLARALAHECGVNFIPIKGPELLNKYVGESESNVRKVFKMARRSAPCIIFFDEIDALVSMRGMHSGGADVSDKVTAQLLTEIDGIEPLKGVFLLAATNRLDLVDTALLRAGRFDYKIYLPPPGDEARLKIFEIHTRGKPLADDVDLQKLVERTKPIVLGPRKLLTGETVTVKGYFSGAEIENICRMASERALREFVNIQEDPESNRSAFRISMKHFDEVMEEINPSVEAPDENKYEKAPSSKPPVFTREDIEGLLGK